jgi:hypothetical protein
MCICCCGNIYTEPLPSNNRVIFTEPLLISDREVHIYTHRLTGGIYEVRRSDDLTCRDIHTKFYKDWFSHSKVDKGDTQTQRQYGNRISLI